jgi:hypothetical protein
MTANEFPKTGLHLPPFLRDFHDQKDVFKSIGGMDGLHGTAGVSWVDGQCYVIDRFLWFMAQHGYTLQRCRRDIRFYDIYETVKARRDSEAEAFRKMLAEVATHDSAQP